MDVVPRRFSLYKHGIIVILVQQIEAFLRAQQQLMVEQLGGLPESDLADKVSQKLKAFENLLHDLLEDFLVLDSYLQLQPGPAFSEQYQLSNVIGKHCSDAIAALQS